MVAVVERVSRASVTVEEHEVGSISHGLLVLLGVEKDDTHSDLDYIVKKTAGLRIFSRDGKITDSVMDVEGSILLVSQFTLLGDVRRGKRPDFTNAAGAEQARAMYEQCIEAFRKMDIPTQTGEFGAHMSVHSCGDGPVTILLDSKRKF